MRRNLAGCLGLRRRIFDPRLWRDAGTRVHVWISVLTVAMERCAVKETKGRKDSKDGPRSLAYRHAVMAAESCWDLWLGMNRKSSSFTSPPAPSVSVTRLAPCKVWIT